MEKIGVRKKLVGCVVNHVQVSFTSRDWNTAKEGMNKLLSERDHISRENIYSIISDINQNIFCKHIVFLDGHGNDDEYDQEKEEKAYLNTSNTSSHPLFDKVISFICFSFVFCLC